MQPTLHTQGDRVRWHAAVLAATRARMVHQPVLIVAKSPEEAAELRAALRAAGVSAALYQSAHDEHLLGRRFVPGDVVIATNLGGRGSDYKVRSDSSNILPCASGSPARLLTRGFSTRYSPWTVAS